jgi:uncharacterized protein (DUF1499 family)
MKVLGYILVGLLVLVAGALLYVRFAPLDAATWHVDPLTAPTPATPNSWRIAPPGQSPGTAGQPSAIYRATPAELMAAFDRIALQQPETTRIAGTPEEGLVTYVQRTKLVKYPDYISVKAVDVGDGRSALAVLSRSRYGKSDMGVNKARMAEWLKGLAPLQEEAPVPAA